MANRYNQVYVDDKEKFIEIQPEFLYLTIPADYICTYHKLLVYLADFGKKLLDDCSAVCKGNNKTVIDCWNLFQSALACKSLGQDKQASLFIDYINKQLEQVYRGTDEKVFNGGNYYPITPDGKLKALCSCQGEAKFMTDVETGQMYQVYLDNKDENATFTIEDNDLIVENDIKI